MASALKSAVSSMTGSDTGDDSNKADNYRLSVTAGPSYDKDSQKPLTVNGPSVAVSESAKVSLRIKDYTGLPSSSPASHPYFDHAENAKDTFSVAFSVVPSKDTPVDDLYFVIDTGHNPIKKFGLSKSLIDSAFKVAKQFIDGSLHCDAFAEEPWVGGPVLQGATTTFRVGETSKEKWDAPGEDMSEGAVGEGKQERERTGMPEAADKRRKWVGSNPGFKLQKGRQYDFDFANGYIDWKNYALKLPGFSWSPLKHIGDKSHKVRFVLKNIKTGECFFVIMVTLLAGEEMKAAIEADQKGGQPVAGQQQQQQQQQMPPQQSQGQGQQIQAPQEPREQQQEQQQQQPTKAPQHMSNQSQLPAGHTISQAESQRMQSAST
ncbi:hypothetical protein MBLNU457_6440t1 [Dothideomycetes sp. NU457]